MSYNLESEFDISEHKSHYVNYLEIVIHKDGRVEYAIPSHQEKLSDIACKRLNITKSELWASMSIFDDVLVELCDKSECISVWNDFYYAGHSDLTEAQLIKLTELKIAGLYTGSLTKVN